MAVLLAIYLIIVNIVAYVTMGKDKAYAKRKKRRVPEARLFQLAFLGGALGILAAMSRYRHKTLHASFRFGIPALLVLNAAIAAYLFMILPVR